MHFSKGLATAIPVDLFSQQYQSSNQWCVARYSRHLTVDVHLFND